MAIETLMRDDTDGSYEAKPRRFSIGSIEYEIDLNDANYTKMLAMFDYYRTRARVAPPAKKTRTNHAPLLNDEDRDNIRAWAALHGRTIPTRGRFPNALIRDYYADIKKNPRTLVYAR